MNEKKLLYLNGNLYINDFDAFKKYYDFIRQNGLGSNNRGISTPTNWKQFIMYKCIGYDRDKNSYWAGAYEKTEMIFIISPEGFILDSFKNRIGSFGAGIILAPSGDIYFMSLGNGGVSFYKITRRW
jgi:hypothetical protein